MGKEPCAKERLAKLEIMDEKERGHCFRREDGKGSRGENFRGSDDRSLSTSAGATGVEVLSSVPM